MDVRNITQVMVLKDVATNDANTQIWDVNAATYVPIGGLAVTDEGGTVLTTATATLKDKIAIRYRTNTSLLKSAPIDGGQITSYLVEAYTAATEEVWTIGSASEAFATVLDADTDYDIRIVRKDDSLFNVPERYKRVNFVSTATTTQAEIVEELANRLYESFSGSTVKQTNALDIDLRVERVNDGALTASDLPADLVVVEGSRIVTTSSAVTGNLLAGTLIAITRTDAASVSLRSIYKLAEDATATTLVLDIPYQGASATIAHAGCGSVVVGTNWGLHLEGKALPFVPGLFRYEKSMFDVETFKTISGTNTRVQAANRGIGTYEEVAEKEWEGIGFYGEQYLVNTPENGRTLLADSTCTYDRVTIGWENKTVDNIAGSVNHSGNVSIYAKAGAAENDAATYGFVRVLDAYIVTNYGFGTVQVGNLT